MKKDYYKITLTVLIVLLVALVITGIVVYQKYYKENDDAIETKIEELKKDAYKDISDNFKLSIKSTYYQQNSYGFYTIEGRIQNISNKSYDSLNIVYQCYDENDEPLALAIGDAANVKAGETTDFYAVSIESSGIDHCKLKYINESDE